MSSEQPEIEPSAAEGPAAAEGAALASLALSASLRLHTRLGRYARRTAGGVALLAPFFGPSLTVLPSCVIAGMIYGHLGQSQCRRGRFAVSRAGIHDAGGALLLPRAAIGMGFALEPRDGRSIVCFTEGRQLVAELSVDDPSDAARVLSLMGLGPEQLALEVEGALSPPLRALGGVLAGALGALAFFVGWHLGSLPLLLLATFALFHAVLAMVLCDVRVAGDGVWVSAPLSRRFIPFAEVEGVSEAGLWLRLHTTRGDVAITSPLLWPGVRASAARQALLLAVREGMASVAALPEPLPASTAHIGLGPREGSFRELPLSAEDLLRVVESARAPSSARARAAASLLRSDPGQGHVERVRVAAERSASPQLRRALTCAIGQNDEAAMAEAIAALEAEDEPLRAGTRTRPSVQAERSPAAR